MKYRVIISDDALWGVRRFLEYIADGEQQPLPAFRWWEKALAKIGTLERMPRRCPLAPENDRSAYELRMLIIDRCLFIFHVDDETRTVRIVGFRHGSQQGPTLDLSATRQ
jgi:plasmid stabilization system protein ParE